MNKKILFLLLISMTFLPIINTHNQNLNYINPQMENVDIQTSQTGRAYDNTVMILMNTTLNNSINSEVLAFMQDIQVGLACNVSLWVYPDSYNHSQIRTFLYKTHAKHGLRGAILIGEVPAFWFEGTYSTTFGYKYYRFPTDYYYMDLDCIFDDGDGNMTADNIDGTVGAEIWVSRIDASKLANEVNLYKDFFARNHLARNVGSRGAQKGLLWIDDSWQSFPWSFQIDACLGELYPTANRTYINNSALTMKMNYLTVDLMADYEWLWACIHSNTTAHAFEDVPPFPPYNWCNWSEVNQTQKNMTFYNLYTCSAGNFTGSNYLAAWYIFGNTDGQLSISCPRPGGFWYGTHDFFRDLSTGDCIGEAWKKMYRRGYMTSEYPTGFREPFPTYWQWMGNNVYWKDYTEGTNLFGDPTLQNCKNPTRITTDPVPTIISSLISPKNVSVNISAKILDQDLWSLYNVSLIVEANLGSGWQILSTNLTNINGEIYYILNLTNISMGNIPVRVRYAGSPNFILSSTTISINILPWEIFLLIASGQQQGITDLLFSPIGIAAIAGGGALVLILIVVAAKKKS